MHLPTDAPLPGPGAMLLWTNELGGTTHLLPDGAVLKCSPPGAPRLEPEVARLRWAAPFTPVPRVRGHGADDRGEWLVTDALPGRSAVDPVWRERPHVAVTALGVGLRAFHDALPVASCPFEWSIDARMATVHADVPPDVRRTLAAPPPVDRLVVCHGDPCPPNTLLDDDGRACAHVDLGAMGVADRWADLAVVTMALAWNYAGDDLEETLLAAYGVDPNPGSTAFYRALWNHTGDDLVPAA